MNLLKHVPCLPRLVPLKLAREGEASGMILVVCCVTGIRERWNDACRNGWTCDPLGQSFNAYYSPNAVAQIREAINASKVA